MPAAGNQGRRDFRLASYFVIQLPSQFDAGIFAAMPNLLQRWLK